MDAAPSVEPDAGVVEKVAQAIYEADDVWCVAFPWPNPDGLGRADNYRRIARAAIAAMPGGWRTDEKPKTGEWIVVRAECTYRWLPYKPGAPQRKHGKMGRWQEADEYGFKNCPEPVGDWRPSPPARSALQGGGHD